MVEVIETPLFTRDITEFVPDDSYRLLEQLLGDRPEAGDLIPGGGGLRKIRWALPGKGKRGGLRVIYYFDAPDVVYMLLVYKKSKQSDLTSRQLGILKNLIREWLA
jgi:mRNA-degrading endonuclease RelE of RelBE toxin-antitoxin system